jgi:hypothetical protein
MMQEAQGNMRGGSGARPLPASWFFDGKEYVDFSGTKRLIRPDIEDVLEEYIAGKNDHIRRYNRLLLDEF